MPTYLHRARRISDELEGGETNSCADCRHKYENLCLKARKSYTGQYWTDYELLKFARDALCKEAHHCPKWEPREIKKKLETPVTPREYKIPWWAKILLKIGVLKWKEKK